MASTNKTTNYNLSQYIGSDKPTYLGDYNSDMLKIDTQMKTNADNISSTGASAQTALENASTALTNANNAQTSADTAQTTADSAQNTASTALSKATTNEASINALSESLDWINFGNVITATTTGSASTGINASYNPKIKLLNLWGYDHLSPALPDNSIVGRLPETFPAPASNRTLEFCGVGTNSDRTTDTCRFIIDTDRYIRVKNDTNKNKEYLSFSIIVNTAFWN